MSEVCKTDKFVVYSANHVSCAFKVAKAENPATPKLNLRGGDSMWGVVLYYACAARSEAAVFLLHYKFLWVPHELVFYDWAP